MLRSCVVSGRGFIRITGLGEDHNFATTSRSHRGALLPQSDSRNYNKIYTSETTEEETAWKRSELVGAGEKKQKTKRVYIFESYLRESVATSAADYFISCDANFSNYRS